MVFKNVIVKNDAHEPDLRREGTYICQFPQPPPPPKGIDKWAQVLPPHERLYYNQTMSSVRYSKRFRASPNIPKDSLDFQLQSRYDHGRETFPEKVDAVLQRDTIVSPCPSSWQAEHGQKEVGSDTRMNLFRVLRNTKVIQVHVEPALGHPLRIGKYNE